MVDSKENYKFDLGVKGFTDYLHLPPLATPWSVSEYPKLYLHL